VVGGGQPGLLEAEERSKLGLIAWVRQLYGALDCCASQAGRSGHTSAWGHSVGQQQTLAREVAVHVLMPIM